MKSWHLDFLLSLQNNLHKRSRSSIYYFLSVQSNPLNNDFREKPAQNDNQKVLKSRYISLTEGDNTHSSSFFGQFKKIIKYELTGISTRGK